MIVVHTTIPFDPDRFDEATAAVRELLEQSRAEPGVVRYRAMADLADEHTVRFFEQYEDEAAWEAHTETDHYRAFLDRLPGLVDGEMESVNFVDVDDPAVQRFTVADLPDGG